MSMETEQDEVSAEDELENGEWDSDEEDTGVGQIAKVALGIDDAEIGNYDGKSTPLNGSQYLLSVMKEAKKSPQVVVADVAFESIKTPNIPLLNSVNDLITEENRIDLIFLPTRERQTSIVSDFSELRSEIDAKRSLIELGRIKISPPQMPEKGNVVLWFKYCFGTRLANSIINKPKGLSNSKDFNATLESSFSDLSLNQYPMAASNVDAAEEEISVQKDTVVYEGCRPLLRIMLCLSQRLIEFLIGCHLIWLKKYGLFNSHQGEWIYALLTCVQKPLEPSVVSDIREIGKTCIFIRTKFCTSKAEKEVDSSEVSMSEKELEYLNSLNLFICIIANYFGQSDLALQN